MGALPLDNEFQQYWPMLSKVEKESLLSIAKHFVQLKQENETVSIEQYNKEIEQALSEIASGDFISDEQAKKESEIFE